MILVNMLFNNQSQDLTKGNQGGGALYDSIRYTLDEEQKGFHT